MSGKLMLDSEGNLPSGRTPIRRFSTLGLGSQRDARPPSERYVRRFIDRDPAYGARDSPGPFFGGLPPRWQKKPIST